MNIYEEILGQMQEYSAIFDVLIDFEQEKFEAVKDQKLETLDGYLKKEQAYLLQVRGLEVRREELLKKAALPQTHTFRQIINDAEGDIKGDLQNLYQELDDKIARFKNILESVNEYIDLKLFSVEGALDKIREFEGQKEPKLYDKNAKKTVQRAKTRFESTKA